MKKWLILCAATIFVSFSGIFVRLANETGFISAFYRILFALLFIAPVYLTRKRRGNLADIVACLLGGFLFGYELALWNMSVVLLNATIPTLLVNLSCIWIGLFSFLVLKERISLAHWIGTAIALIGVVVIIGYTSILELKIEKGVLYAILCSVMISVYTLLVKKARNRIDSISVLFYTLLGSLIGLITWALIGKENLRPLSNLSWPYLIGLGILVQGFGYLSINYALGYISSAKVTLMLLLQPVFTGLLAAVLLDEKLKTSQILGSTIVLLGLLISFITIGKDESKGSQKKTQ